MSLKTCLLAVAVALIAAATMTTAGDATCSGDDCRPRPWFCRGFDCPSFKVLETSGSWELRRYSSARWLVTKVEGRGLFFGQVEGTKRLIGYLAGYNTDRTKVAPATPLATLLFPEDEEARSVDGKVFVALPLPDYLQDDAPRPRDDRVRIIKSHSFQVYVDPVFGEGLPSSAAIVRHGYSFIHELQHLGRKVVDRAFVYASYNPPPWVLLAPYSEVWVPRRCRRRTAPSEGRDEEADEYAQALQAWLGGGGDDEDGDDCDGESGAVPQVQLPLPS